MKKIDKTKIKRILLVSFSNIGDAVLSLPVLENLHRHFTDAVTDVVVGPRASIVFENDLRVNELIVYDKKTSIGSRVHFFISPEIWDKFY